MKHARNLFLALALLVLLYGGVYRFLFRESVRESFIKGYSFASEPKKWRDRVFAPAAEFDLRLTVDRPLRKRLRGRWLNPANPDDFVTITGNGRFMFRLGELTHEGDLEINRKQLSLYHAFFQHAGRFHTFGIAINASGRADACIHDLQPLGDFQSPKSYKFSDLTPAP